MQLEKQLTIANIKEVSLILVETKRLLFKKYYIRLMMIEAQPGLIAR